ncbi:MAG: hypothetical protein COX77_02135 [Candidatus Komeilibacteria bacterium CG_4_10_14_0_2_um_filter_37_10]|uniref:Uncharacterized protein n=1 Tax=Candidatus Komeilibacteria bacterium CG_4_10_14_0_2_um_filter_37_10 TaxID=1974470 RepID=A0A2M7VFB8_9BACT|nr:MAG: hypothetical protein COX77_02135 [Candidatus Komeilibacteria bacterium CG_4_10_14_0_2_um_filter_37_10]
MINNSIYKKILSLQKIPKQDNKKSRIFIDCYINNNHLLLMGFKHQKKISKSTIKILTNNFNNFLSKYDAKKIIVIVEGPHWNNHDSKKEIIKKYRESSVLALLAKKNNITIQSIEPSSDDLLEIALKKIKKPKYLATWILLNVLSSLLKKNKLHKNNQNSLINILNFLNKEFNLRQQSPNDLLVYFNKIIKHVSQQKNILPNTLDEITTHQYNKKVIAKIINPQLNNNVINNVATEINKIRDYLITERIIRLLKHRHIISVYGWNHVYCQQYAYKKSS